MGNNLFGADIAGKLAKALGPLVNDLSFEKKAEADRSAGSLTGGRSVSYRKYPCKGTFKVKPMAYGEGSSVVETTVEVLILGETLPPTITPEPGDRVILPNKDIVTVAMVKGDPDRAAWTLSCRD